MAAAEIRPARLTRPPFRVRSWPTPTAPAIAPVAEPPESNASLSATVSAIDDHAAPVTAPGASSPTEIAPVHALVIARASTDDEAHTAELEMLERGTPDALVGSPTGASDVLLAEANRIEPAAVGVHDATSTEPQDIPNDRTAADAISAEPLTDASGAFDGEASELPGIAADLSAADAISAELLADAGSAFDDDESMTAMEAFELHVESVEELTGRETSAIDEALQAADDASDEEWDTPWMAGLLASGVAAERPETSHVVTVADEPVRGSVAADVFERLAHRIRGGEIPVPDRTAESGDAAVLAAVLSSLLLGRTTD